MEPSKLSLEISGPLLGKILHEHYKHGGSCGGVLFGEIISETKCEITDSQHVIKSETSVCVKDYLTTSSKNFLKSLSSTKTETLLTDSYSSLSSCIGLFKIRNSSNTLSLLEKSIHRKLCKDLQAKSDTKESDFIVSMLITYGTNTDATCLDWTVRAFVLYKSIFSTIKIKVSNLQGSVNNLYMKSRQSSTRNVQSTSANQLLETFQTHLTVNDNKIQVVDATGKVTQDLIKELDHAFDELYNAEQKLEKTMLEKSALISVWNTLQGKKLHLQKSWLNQAVDERQQDSDDWPKRSSREVAFTEAEYQAIKRRSMEDMKRRSPIVVLDKLDSSQERSVPCNSNSISANLNPVPMPVKNLPNKSYAQVLAPRKEEPLNTGDFSSDSEYLSKFSSNFNAD
uniref:uncharacterized protein LOC120328968 n=1 Tax=Styela clava TaxID=7725 RepID=UPI00193A2EE6|nr:uncharacterized protein LOC120328968 [Styela clava]